MTDVTGSNTPGGAKPRRAAKPKTGFAAVDEEAKILESAAVQGEGPGDLTVSQHGEISSQRAGDRAEGSSIGSDGGSLGAGTFAAGSEGGTGAAMAGVGAEDSGGGSTSSGSGSSGSSSGGASGGGGSASSLSEEDSVALAALEAAQARARSLRDWAMMRRDEAGEAVRANPIGSSVMVFGAGMILGLLLARR